MPVADDVFDHLVGQILDGGLAPGDPLPGERGLAEALGVNRQAVREALKRLEAIGLVAIQHGGATRARDFRTHAGLEILPRLIVRDGRIDPAVVRSILEMRSCLGPDAAKLAAERATPAAAAAITDVVAGMEQGGDLADLDRRFWDLVVDAADNVAYRLAYNTLQYFYEPVRPIIGSALASESGDVDAHRAVADAIAAGDGTAARDAARVLLAAGTAAIASLLATPKDQ